MRVLIIEDEDLLRAKLVKLFEDSGFTAESAIEGEKGLYLVEQFNFDLAVLDLGLPDISGMDLIKRMRALGKNFPILILTARGQWQDKVEGLESGADDYLVKPFQSEELIARANALLRRAAGWANPVLKCGEITLDTKSQVVKVSSKPVELTSYEYKLLEYMMLNAGKVVSKAELTEHLYAQDYDRDSNVIEVFVGRLRRKLDPENSVMPLETLRGRGYRFALDRE